MEVLETSRDVHRPRRVAEVTTQLAGDRRSGEGAERYADRRVEALYRLEHAQPGDLQEVVDRLAPAGEAHRLAGQVEVHLDQLVAQPLITRAVIFTKRFERLGGLRFHR